MPNHAVMVHGELGAPVCEAVATAGVCLSGATALKYGWMSVVSGGARNAVVTGSGLAAVRRLPPNPGAEPLHGSPGRRLNPRRSFENEVLPVSRPRVPR